MKKQIIIGLAAVAVLVALLYPQPIWVRIGLAKWKWHEKDIEFYGKVVDPDNTPVEGALVTVNVPKQVGFMAARRRPAAVITDNNGRFEVSRHTYRAWRLRGSFLFIEDIQKEGFGFSKTGETCTFEYRSDYTDCHLPKKEEPVVFHMTRLDQL